MLSQTTSLCCNLPCMYQKQCRIHGEPIQHRTNEPIGTRNSVRYMVNPCSTGNCCLHTMCQVPKKWMKCYVVCKIPILQLQKYRKFYFSSSAIGTNFHQWVCPTIQYNVLLDTAFVQTQRLTCHVSLHKCCEKVYYRGI